MKKLLLVLSLLLASFPAFGQGNTAENIVLGTLTTGASCGSGPSPCWIPISSANPLVISTSGGGGSGTVTSLTAGTGLSASPSTITTTGSYSLLQATTTSLGGIVVGSGLAISTTGVLSASGNAGVSSFTGDGALITNSASTGAVTATLGTTANITLNSLSVTTTEGIGKSLNFTSTTATAPLNGLYSSTTNSLSVTTSGATAMTITSTGSVGIGTTSLAYPLEITGNSAGATTLLNLYNSNGGAGSSAVIRFAFSSSSDTTISNAQIAGIRTALSPGTVALTFSPSNGGTGPFEAMRVDSTGYVGIGTTGPTDKLDIAGAIGLTTTTATAPLNGLYSSTTNSLSVTTSGATAMTITSTGSVGIGTTSPGDKLDIAGGIGLTTTTATLPTTGIYSATGGLRFTTTGATAMTITTTGSVGIGTSAPSSQLNITGAFVSNPSTLTISTSTFTPISVGSNTFRIVLIHADCPCTVANPSGTAVDGEKFILEIWQSSTGSDTIGTWGSSYDFGTAGAPTLTTTASKGDYIGFSYSAQNSKYNYLGIQQGF